MPYIRSFTSVVITGVNFLNCSKFVVQGTSLVTFTLNVSFSVVQRFCLSVVLCHWSNLGAQPTLNASITSNLLINSSDPPQNLAAHVSNNFGMNPVYGPVFNYKCVMGFTSFQVGNIGNIHTVQFDLNSSPKVVGDNSSSAYLISYSTFCFVNLQCQFLYQQYYVLINDCQDACTLSNCLVCTTATSCSSCEAGYFLNSLLRCQQCIPNCASCSNTVSCDTCQPGYFYNSTALACQVCAPFCLTCSIGICSSCLTGYYPSLDKCIPCANAIANCVTCNSASSCTKCKDGFTFGNGQSSCFNCASLSFCKTCSLTYRCATCIDGYYMSGLSCLQCSFTIA